MIDFSKKPLFLAPLAGFSDIALRGVVKRFGCDVTTSEMISANALCFKNEKTLKMLEKNSLETPYIVQIAGNDEEIIKKAVLILNEFDFIDGIDFNCGCPATKVVKNCSGSALLKDLDKLCKLLEVIKKQSNKKFTSVKIRLGFDEKIPQIIVKKLQNLDLSYIAIHGRTKADGYSGKADYDSIREAKEVSLVPIIANGDINSQNAQDVLNLTLADGLMIGRASIGNPWIFYEVKSGKKVDEKIKKEIILCHFDEMIKHYGTRGALLFRKHIHQYSKGLDMASAFRDEINRIDDVDLARSKISEFF
ncbi:tRNA-dihydrouridine synthase [Campylobacter sp. FMV-PI01]|uniref:tRNA-dihydrouridine synthase n=1 Tax=Campylobacter portucalensis TaxID=2608384 RepID=A0A6L5WKX3_9BACT|nr:tRNA-dihydrouridine synthase [Campylobacter portucalensis]MSN96655.1 tRNA-dihydrouridine synthase [Campylobacter portucalensis]